MSICVISLQIEGLSMATNMPQPTPVVLKSGHHLRGKDMIPVVQRLQSLSRDDWEKKEGGWARLSGKHTLESYTGEEIAKEFNKLTNYDIWVSINMSSKTKSVVPWKDKVVTECCSPVIPRMYIAKYEITIHDNLILPGLTFDLV